MTIRHWGIAVKSHFGDDVGECEATAGLQHASEGAARPPAALPGLSAPLLIIITATVAILCLNHRFAGVPPHKVRRCRTRGIDANVVA